MAELLWLNGKILPVDQARISPLDRGFLYGDGLFETLRAEKKCPLYLSEHLARLQAAAEALKIILPVLDWRGIIHDLLTENGLEESAKVKVLLTRGQNKGSGTPASASPTLLVTAEAYLPCHSAYQEGWMLRIERGYPTSSLARFKSLNYLNCLLAKQAALDGGADDAVMLDPEGFVAECSSGSLLIRSKGSWVVSNSPARLPGITEKIVIRLLEKRGLEVKKKDIAVADLLSAETVWLLNSLLVIMPVCRVDERFFEGRTSEAASLRSDFLAEGL
ncbi:MAG TPA: aminotransferase class IV [Chroococcales cyanobacterium]|jgi:branched-subunit amino acid aminotransferase/4-amino-4-deoxychorismate lyase